VNHISIGAANFIGAQAQFCHNTTVSETIGSNNAFSANDGYLFGVGILTNRACIIEKLACGI
jgi:hypothetical protein